HGSGSHPPGFAGSTTRADRSDDRLRLLPPPARRSLCEVKGDGRGSEDRAGGVGEVGLRQERTYGYGSTISRKGGVLARSEWLYGHRKDSAEGAEDFQAFRDPSFCMWRVCRTGARVSSLDCRRRRHRARRGFRARETFDEWIPGERRVLDDGDGPR